MRHENLISSFIEIVSRHGSLAAGIRAMNATLDTRYTHSRLREWERGDRQPTPQVMDYMLGIVLPWLLEQADLSPADVARLVRHCRLPSH